MDEHHNVYEAGSWDEAKLEALATANSRGDGPIYSPERIEEIAAEVDVLIVVYPDATQSLSIGVLMAKGEDRMAEISASGVSQLLHTTAIHGTDLFHAIAIRDRLAAGTTHH